VAVPSKIIMRKVYLDFAAATYIDPVVLRRMKPFLSGVFGNPSSLHSMGREARVSIEKARSEVSAILEADAKEIIFTGSGTESDNLAAFGIAGAYQDKGKHIIISKIEHPAVMEAAKKLENRGFEITYLDVNGEGLVDLSKLKKALRKDTILVSIIYANNEIGVIQPIGEIAGIIGEFRKNNSLNHPFFHTDACQAAGALDLNVKKLGVDLMTLNGSKIYGPKGIGCLYVSGKINLEPVIVGGGQERGLRAGTENNALIAGFAEALKLSEKMKNKESKRVGALRDFFIQKITKAIPCVQLNGSAIKRLPNNINISISGIEGEAMLLMLDSAGICVSTGSACSSRSLDPSHVLLAIGMSPELAHGSLRITLGRKTTKSDLNYVLKALPPIVEKLRKISAVKL